MIPASEPHQPAIALEDFLPYRLNVLSARVSTALAGIYEERFGLGIPEWRVLATLGQFETCTARDITAHSFMHKSTTSRAVSALARRGLIARAANPDDKREELLTLTQEGRAVYGAIVPEALAFSERLEAALAPAERATFVALLERLDRHARSLSDEPRAEAAE